jgi:GTPase SAR1 family protein
VLLLGVGGVGKTTLAYRLLGLSLKLGTTLRPGIYRVYLDDRIVQLIDVPGQHAVEVARAAAKHVYADRALLVFDLSRLETYYALHEIRDALCMFERCLAADEVWVVGNKRDIAVVDFEPDLAALGAQRYVAISALYDPPEVLKALLL